MDIASIIAIFVGLTTPILGYVGKRVLDKLDNLYSKLDKFEENFNKHLIEDSRIATIVEARYEAFDDLKVIVARMEGRLEKLSEVVYNHRRVSHESDDS